MARLAGSRIIVTGSAGGFGSAIVALLEREGAQVVGIDRASGGQRRWVACDIAERSATEVAVATAIDRLGGLDVLVNNAGIGTAAPAVDGVDDVAHAVFDVNVMGTWNVTAAALPHLLETRGHVINVASLLAVVTLPWVSAYAASKRAVCALSDTLRIEHADAGLAVTTVYPGYVATAIHHEPERRSGLSLRGRVPEERVDQVAATVVRTIQRRPRDVATSRTGSIVLRLARVAPGLVDAAVRASLRRQPLAQRGRG